MRSALFALALAVAALAAAAQSLVATVPGTAGVAIAVDSVTHRAYVADAAANRVHVLDGATLVASVPVGRSPRWVAVNSAAGRVYVSNDGDATLSILDAHSSQVLATLPLGGAGPIAINETTGIVYVMRRGNNGEITVVNGSSWYSITTESYVPDSMVINTLTNTLYVTHPVSGDVRAVDLRSTSDHPPSAGIQIAGRPGPIALNASTNRIYVASDDRRASVTVIDGFSNVGQQLDLQGHGGTPFAMAVNPTANRAYASFANEIAVVNGATNAVSFIATGSTVTAFAVDGPANRTYALAGSRTLITIDGATQATGSVALTIDATALATDSGMRRLYVAGPGGVAMYATSFGAVGPRFNMQGIWWASPAGSESGWGLDVAQQGNSAFAAWFTYDAAGNAQWYVMPLSWSEGSQTFDGTVYRVTGPPYSAATFDPARVSATVVGTARLVPATATLGTLIVVINGMLYEKSITRQVFGPLPTCSADAPAAAQANYTDLWWNAPAGSESGWGLFLNHQGDIIFAVWFTYDTDGRALWFAATAPRVGAGVYSGTMYRTTGPSFTIMPWPAAQVSATAVGSITLSFSDASRGSFAYTIGNVSGFKAITREVFSTPATVCR